MDYEQLKSRIDSRLAADPAFRAVSKRIGTGRATFADTAEYSRILARIIGNELSANVLNLADREQITKQLLQYGYKDINEVCARMQSSLDKTIGVNIRPQTADFPAERVQQFSHSLVDPTVEDSVIQRRAKNGTANITMSFHDDYIEKNAKFRNDAGLKCYIERIGSSCCDWCTEVAGKYLFGTQPKDIFRRHDKCDCVIIYDNKVLRGKKNAKGESTKTWEEIPDTERADYTPERISQRQAEKLQNQKLSQIRGLRVDNSGRSGIIRVELESLIRFSDNREVPQNIRASIENTMSVIPEKLRSRLEQFVPEIIIEEGKGYSCFTPDNNIILDMENANNSILHELGHAWARMDSLYEDEEFLAVLADGLDRENWGNITPYTHPYKNEPVYVLPGDKFVEPYQGRVYADIFSVDYSEPIDLHSFQEYISVGFETYFLNPELLKAKDIKLFNYLERKING